MVKKIIQKNLMILMLNDLSYLVGDLMRKYSFDLRSCGVKSLEKNVKNSNYKKVNNDKLMCVKDKSNVIKSLIIRKFYSKEYKIKLVLRIRTYFEFK